MRYLKCIKSLIQPPWKLIYSSPFEGELNEEGGLIILEKKMVSVLHKELEQDLEQLDYKKVGGQLRTRINSELPLGKYTIPNQSTRSLRSADVFPVVASLDDRKYVCASQASPYEVLQLVVIDNKVYHLQVKNDKGRGERAYGERGGRWGL